MNDVHLLFSDFRLYKCYNDYVCIFLRNEEAIMDTKILDAIEPGLVYAIIPARSGSKSVKDKNIRLLAGHPMIAYTIAAAKLSEEIDRVIVSTDSEKYAQIAKDYGAEAPFLRPAQISGDAATDKEFMEHAIEWCYEHEGKVPQYWVHLRVTCPFRDPKVIDEGIAKIKKHPEATCLLSISMVDDYLTAFKWLVLDGEEYCKSIFFDNNDDANRPRQTYPDAYIPSVYVDVLTTRCIVEDGVLHGNKMVNLITEKTMDIDTEEDFEKAVQKANDAKYAIYSYLEENSK